MAAPNNKSLADLNGKWKMNRDLSDDVDSVLQIQGFNTVMRTAIAHAPVYLHITQSKDGDSDKYRIDQSTTANIPAVKEEWITDFEFRESKDPVMGRVRAKARWSEPRKIEDADFLADVPGGWFDEGKQQVEAFVESPQGGWTAHQVWGFERVQGQKMFVRRIVVKKDEQVEKVKLVYDFQSDKP